MDLDITSDQLKAWLSGEDPKVAFRFLTDDEIDFIVHGVPPTGENDARHRPILPPVLTRESTG